MAQSFASRSMSLDNNEEKLIKSLTEALHLLEASEEDIHTIVSTKTIDADFLKKASKIFEGTEACDVCRHAFYSWRNTVDDETLLSFIEDWVTWKKKIAILIQKAAL